MKKKIIFALSRLSFLLLLTNNILFTSETLKGAPYQHWPSIKTTDWMPGSTDDWIATHYDWIDSAPSIDFWYGKNPNVKTDIYAFWNSFSFANDPPSGTNVGNMLMRWYEYCANNNLDWEDGFLHLGTQDTYVRKTLDVFGQQLDAKIRYIYRNSSTTNYADSAWAGTASLSLATLNDAIYFGRLDRFNEINLQFSIKASDDWQGIWEYWNGASWVNLPLVSDGTNDSQQDGQIVFTPPNKESWQRTKVNNLPTFWGNKGIYFIRLRAAAAGSVAPVIKLAQGRHYWVHSDTDGNTLLAWDPANDPDNDGFAEAQINSNATAKFKYESRIVDTGWSWGLISTNLRNPTLRQKLAEFTVDNLNTLAGTHKHLGARLDSADGTAYVAAETKDKILEYPGVTASEFNIQYLNDWIQTIQNGKSVLNNNGYLLGGNVSHTGPDAVNAVFDFHERETALAADRVVTPGFWGNWEERIWQDITAPDKLAQWSKWGDLGRPMLWQWNFALYIKLNEQGKYVNVTNGSKDVTGVGTNWLETLQPGSIVYLSSGKDYFAEVESVNSNTSCTLKEPWNGPTLTGVWHTMMLARDKYMALAAFLVIQKPETDYFSTWWSNYYGGAKAPYFNWIPAVTLDYSQPTGIIPAGKDARGTRGAYVLQTGDDPTSTYPYFVYARDYTKALAVVRPVTGNGSFLTNSAVTVNLPATPDNPSGKYYLVDYFGNVSTTPVTRVTLRNAEGAILIKESALQDGTDTEPPALEEEKFASDLNRVKAYPNPYRGDKHSQIIFDNLTANIRIKIYTLKGELVREIKEQGGDRAYWDVRNKNGEKVSSGTYIYYITNPKGQEKKGKAAIIR